VTPGFTSDEIREFVREYYRQPYGTRGAWLTEQRFTDRQFRRWRKIMLAGDLDRGLVPRDHSDMSIRDGVAVLAKEHVRQISQQEAQIAGLQARIVELEGTNEALGKAIGLLHKMSEQEPDATPTTSSHAGS